MKIERKITFTPEEAINVRVIAEMLEVIVEDAELSEARSKTGTIIDFEKLWEIILDFLNYVDNPSAWEVW